MTEHELPDVSRQGAVSVKSVMAADERKSVARAGLKFHIDVPSAGYRTDGYLMDLSGWVVSTKQAVSAILVRTDLWCLMRCTLDVPRPDVARLYSGAIGTPKLGFQARVCVLGVDEIELLALMTDGKTVPLARVAIRSPALPPPKVKSGPRPLLVVGMGRSGTTWTMRLLGNHPEILVAGSHPFEVKAAGFWAEQMRERLHVQPFRRPTPDEARPPVPHPLAGNAAPPAMANWFAGADVEAEADRTRQRIADAYQQITRSGGDSAYFAEKDQQATSNGVVSALFPRTQRLILTRDPRDILCSMRAFDTRRGYLAFGRELCASEEEHVDLVAARFNEIHRQWTCRPEGAVWMRYEDLIQDPAGEVGRLFGALGIEESDATVKRVIAAALHDDAETHQHITSPTAALSVGRWRQELPVSHRRRLEKAAGSALEAFGYAGG